jgi:hypothetical protein
VWSSLVLEIGMLRRNLILKIKRWMSNSKTFWWPTGVGGISQYEHNTKQALKGNINS